jgi:hypothetical protein
MSAAEACSVANEGILLKFDSLKSASKYLFT